MEKAVESNPLLTGLDLALGGEGNNFPVRFWEINCFCLDLQKKLTVYSSLHKPFKIPFLQWDHKICDFPSALQQVLISLFA